MTFQSTPEQQAAARAMLSNYDAARAKLAATGLFGKTLDRQDRKLALSMGGVEIPEGMTVARATPHGWGAGPLGYRGQTAQDMRP